MELEIPGSSLVVTVFSADADSETQSWQET